MPSQFHITLPPTLTSPEARYIITTLERAGGKARFVGGCVRDAILKQTPGDIDIATSLPPETVTTLLESAEVKVIPTGLRHGTVTVVIHKKPFEITTLRRDIDCFGRHAVVEYTDNFEEDAARRDFTINAMYCDLEGTIYDYFGGYEDAQKGIVRFVGDAKARIAEDYLRILRFFRFLARFGKTVIDMEALAAINFHASSLDSLSGERIQKEMLGLLAVPYLDTILETMAESRVLAHIALPCSNFAGFKELLMLEKEPHPLRRLAIMLRAIPDPEKAAERLIGRWRLSNHDKATLLLLMEHSITENTSLQEQKKLLRREGNEIFIHKVLIAWAEFLASAKDNRHKLTTAFSTMLDLAETWKIPAFPLQGKDLLQLGLDEGKEVGQWLKKAEYWWEEQDYKPDRNAILAYVRQGMG